MKFGMAFRLATFIQTSLSLFDRRYWQNRANRWMLADNFKGLRQNLVVYFN